MPFAKEENRMNAKNAKTTFSFNVFLASIAAEPLGIKYKQIANILNVSESTISKLRHGHLRKMPPALQPSLMSLHFAAEIMKDLTPTCSTARQFAAYAQLLKDKYLFSDSLGRYLVMFSSAEPADEEHAKKFCSGMIPPLLQHCYEEAYYNTEQDYVNWVKGHEGEQSDILYQRMCDAINNDVLDSDKLSQLLSVVYSANLRQQVKHHFSDLTFLKMFYNYVCSQVNQPFYNSVHRMEIISISEDALEIRRSVKAQEQIIPQSLDQLKFTLSQTFYHSVCMPPDEIVNAAFGNLACTVNNIPLVRYINSHQFTSHISPEQFVTATRSEDDVNGMASTELIFAFTLYPEDAEEPLDIAYEYTCTAPFIRNISCNYSFTLHYPCRFLEHECVLDAKTRRNWGIRVKLFTPITNSTFAEKKVDGLYAKSTGTTDSQHVVFHDWAIPGSGYYRNIYELKYASKHSEHYLA